MSDYLSEDRNLAMDTVRVTEAAALASARLMGRGDEKAADQAAVDAMRHALNVLDIDGTVVIGEGERDEAPMLYIGEKVGNGSGTRRSISRSIRSRAPDLRATGGAERHLVHRHGADGQLPQRARHLHGEDRGRRRPARGIVDLHDPPTCQPQPRSPRPRACAIEDLVVLILDRPRHQELIAEVRKAGARIRLISDGDVAGAIATCRPDTGIDIYMGIGGAPEGVLAAAALRCIGGDFQGRLMFRNDEERARAREWALSDLDRGLRDRRAGAGRRDVRGHRRHRRHLLKGVRRHGKRRLHRLDRDALANRHRPADRGRALPAREGRGGTALPGVKLFCGGRESHWPPATWCRAVPSIAARSSQPQSAMTRSSSRR